MNRRDFLTVLGGASVVSVAGLRPVFAESTSSLYLNGLVMLSFEDAGLRIGFPKAPGHKATLQIMPVHGSSRTISLRGNGAVETKATAAGNPRIAVPELVRMSEIYGRDVHARFEKCPYVIEIPYSAIKSVTTSKVTKDRWTFVRGDGQEIDTFRPRQVAETIRLELSSDSVLKLDGGKTSIALADTQEIYTRYAPDAKDVKPDMIIDHFAHYFQYVDRPPAADFVVVPKKVTGFATGAPRKVGNQFMMIESSPLCYLVGMGPRL